MKDLRAWQTYQTTLRKYLRCSFVDEVLIIRELGSHLHASSDESGSPEKVLGNPKELAKSFNRRFRFGHFIFSMVAIPCFCVLIACPVMYVHYYIQEWTFKLGGLVNEPLPLLNVDSVVACSVRGTEHHEEYGFGVSGIVWAQGLKTYPWDKRNDKWLHLPCYKSELTEGQTEYTWASQEALGSPLIKEFEKFPQKKAEQVCENCNPLYSSEAQFLMTCKENPLCQRGEQSVLISVVTNYREFIARNHYISEVWGTAVTENGNTRDFFTDYRTFGDEYGEPPMFWLVLSILSVLVYAIAWFVYNLVAFFREMLGTVGARFKLI